MRDEEILGGPSCHRALGAPHRVIQVFPGALLTGACHRVERDEPSDPVTRQHEEGPRALVDWPPAGIFLRPIPPPPVCDRCGNAFGTGQTMTPSV